MIQLKELRLMNDTMIKYLKNMGMNTKRNEIIKKILNDDACFFKMNKENAYIILQDIGISKEKIASMYLKLVSSDEYYYLQKAGKIKEDEDLIIKHKKYDAKDLFKKKKN